MDINKMREIIDVLKLEEGYVIDNESALVGYGIISQTNILDLYVTPEILERLSKIPRCIHFNSSYTKNNFIILNISDVQILCSVILPNDKRFNFAVKYNGLYLNHIDIIDTYFRTRKNVPYKLLKSIATFRNKLLNV